MAGTRSYFQDFSLQVAEQLPSPLLEAGQLTWLGKSIINGCHQPAQLFRLRSLGASVCQDEQQDSRDSDDAAVDCPFRLPSHEAPRQNVDPLKEENTANYNQH